jgi:2-methylcitrate dehydratase
MSGNVEANVRPNPDEVLVKIADYVLDKNIESSDAYNTARYCLMDTLGCGLLALTFPDCKNY